MFLRFSNSRLLLKPSLLTIILFDVIEWYNSSINKSTDIFFPFPVAASISFKVKEKSLAFVLIIWTSASLGNPAAIYSSPKIVIGVKSPKSIRFFWGE